MAKKGAEKPSQKQKKLSNQEIQLAVLENFVNLQKVLAEMSMKFELLSRNISELLMLFEESAKSFMKKYEEKGETGEDKALLNKLDTLLEQNKTIARGLTLIEEKIRHKIYTEETVSNPDENQLGVIGRPRPKPLPRV